MKRNIVIATVAAAALIGGGSATAFAVAGDDAADSARTSAVRVADDHDDQPRERTADDDCDEARDDEPRETTDGTDADRAIEAALRTVQGRVSSAELEDDGTWDVEIQGKDGKEHDLRVDPKTGKVTADHPDTDTDDDRDSDD